MIAVSTSLSIRRLVCQALRNRSLTPDIEEGINSELIRLGHVPIGDLEVLELLMSEMDAGRIQFVPSP